MARRKSLWNEIQRERDRREKEARERERWEQQQLRQLARQQEQAEKQAERAQAAERERQQEFAHEAGMATAKANREQADARVAELQTLLTSALATPPSLRFGALKRSVATHPFDPGLLARPVPAPRWEDYAPEPPGFLSGLAGGKSRYARAERQARDAFEQAGTEHRRAEASRVRQLASARADHERRARDAAAEATKHNMAVDALETDFRAGDPDSVEEYFTQVLALSHYPPGFPTEYQVAYRTEPRELVIEYRLPGADVIPTVRDYKYVKTRGEITETARPAREISQLYASIVRQVALRTMWECFTAPEGADLVDSVVFNGIVPGTNRATGQPELLHLVSAPADRQTFGQLVLDRLDPAECLKYLKAIVSPHPYDLEAVEPVIQFAQAKYRFADPVDALAGMDSRPDLLTMDWYKFENLVRQLFEAMGLDVNITQSSRDEGIDVVAYNKTDIVRRAEILIQAKRYSKCVPTNDVRALAGSVEEKRASAGILVTTAWVSPESKAFAARNNRIQIIEGGELKHMLAEHLNLDVRIELPSKPRQRK